MCYSLRNIQHLEQDLEQGWCSEITSVMNASISSSSDRWVESSLLPHWGMRLGEGQGPAPGLTADP